MAISVKTSSSVSDGNQLVNQLSIKQPLIFRSFSHLQYRVEEKDMCVCVCVCLSVVGGCVVLLPVDFLVQGLYSETFLVAYMSYTHLVEGHEKRVCTKTSAGNKTGSRGECYVQESSLVFHGCLIGNLEAFFCRFDKS